MTRAPLQLDLYRYYQEVVILNILELYYTYTRYKH